MALVAAALAALGIFTVKHNQINDSHNFGGRNCILFVDEDSVDDKRLSGGTPCLFTIWGSAFVAAGAGLLVLIYIVKIAVGVSV